MQNRSTKYDEPTDFRIRIVDRIMCPCPLLTRATTVDFHLSLIDDVISDVNGIQVSKEQSEGEE